MDMDAFLNSQPSADVIEGFARHVDGVASFVRLCGASYAKNDASRVVVLSGRGIDVMLPVAFSPEDWHLATEDQALFSALREAHGWTYARVSDLDVSEPELADIQRERDASLKRLSDLVTVLGGPVSVDRLFALPGFEVQE